MATYTTDLNTFSDAESGSWYECTATSPEAWNLGDNPASEGDYFIQGSGCRSSDTNAKTGICSGVLDMTTDQSGLFTSGVTCVFIWHVLLPGNAMDLYANDGLRVVVGSGLADFWWWTVGGRDKGRNPYGGWQNYAVDPSKTAGRTAVGSPSGAYRYFGAAADVTSSISKGTMHGWDAIRYGRGRISATSTGATFAGMAQYNDYNDATNGYNRFGLFQAQGGSYLWKGLMELGTSGASVTFSDSARAIFIDDTPHAYPTFNKLTINNTGSSVTMSNCSFTALGTYAPGVFEMVDNAGTCTFNQCVFSGTGTHAYLSNFIGNACVWYKCDSVTAGGGNFTGSQVLESSVAADGGALIWNTTGDIDGKLDGMRFTKGANAHHAIRFSAYKSSHNLRDCTFTSFNASNGQNDSVLYFDDTGSDVTWTINASGCTGTISYKKARAGDTVSVVINPVTLYVYVKDSVTKSGIDGARVVVLAADGAGPYPYQESVTLARSGSTVTVSHTGHGMATDDYVLISGAVEGDYNGIWQITVTGVDAYTYDIGAKTPSTPATGTIVGTWGCIHETTSSGYVSDSRTLTGDQNCTGWVRYAAGAYKPSTFDVTFDSESGGSVTVLMVSDT